MYKYTCAVSASAYVVIYHSSCMMVGSLRPVRQSLFSPQDVPKFRLNSVGVRYFCGHNGTTGGRVRMYYVFVSLTLASLAAVDLICSSPIEILDCARTCLRCCVAFSVSPSLCDTSELTSFIRASCLPHHYCLRHLHRVTVCNFVFAPPPPSTRLNKIDD